MIRTLRIPAAFVAASSVLLSGCVTQMQSLVLNKSANQTWQSGIIYELPVSFIDLELQYSIYKVTLKKDDGKGVDLSKKNSKLLQAQRRGDKTPPAPAVNDDAPSGDLSHANYFATPDVTEWKVSSRTSGDSDMRFAVDYETMQRAGVKQNFDGNTISISDSGLLTKASFQAQDQSGVIAMDLLKTAANIASISTIGIPVAGGALPAGSTIDKDTGKATTVKKDPPEEEHKKLGTVIIRTSFSVEKLLAGQNDIEVSKEILLQTPEVSAIIAEGEPGLPDRLIVLPFTHLNLKLASQNGWTSKAKVQKIRREIEASDLASAQKGKKTGGLPIGVPAVDGIVSRYKGAASFSISGPDAKHPLVSGTLRLVEAGGVQRFKLQGRKLTDAQTSLTFDSSGAVSQIQFGGGSTGAAAAGLGADMVKAAGDSFQAYKTKVDEEKAAAVKAAQDEKASAVKAAQDEKATALAKISATADLKNAVIEAKTKLLTDTGSLQIAKLNLAAAQAAKAANNNDDTKKALIQAQSDEAAAVSAIQVDQNILNAAEARAAQGP